MCKSNDNLLFQKSNLGNLEIKNRFVRSATWENMTTTDGHLNKKIYDIYEELAKNDIGLIITGYGNVVKEEQPNPGMMGAYDSSFISEYKKLTDLVHKYDSKIIMQLAYGGTKTKFNVGERVIFAPSSVPEKSTNVVGKTMTQSDINYVVDSFAKSAKMVKDSGFDGVEIHGAHTYLINQFLSPYYNNRTDNYGGSLENRMRFLIEIYSKMRTLVGNEFPILIKLTATDFFEGGLTFEETKLICQKLESLGIDGIEISGNIHGKAKSMTGEIFDGLEIQEEGYFLEYAKIISDLINIPIITVGGFRDLSSIENIFNSTNIGYFAFSRPLLAEPNLIHRWKNGDTDPAKCVRCSKCRTPEGNYCTIFNK